MKKTILILSAIALVGSGVKTYLAYREYKEAEEALSALD
jgi:hypothetical protein